MRARRVTAGQGRGVMASIHETAVALQQAGVMDRRTLQKFGEACRVTEVSGSADTCEAKATGRRLRKKAP